MIGGAPRRDVSSVVPYVVVARVGFALLGFSALVTEVATLVADHRFVAGNFFSYFTVEANTLAVISLLLGSYALSARVESAAVDHYRGAVALYMMTTILIFIFLLSGYPSSELTAVPWDNTVLHYIQPIAVIGDWLLLGPSHRLGRRKALTWLAFPLAYLGYSLLRGSIVGWYPYPFMSPSRHGYPVVALTSAVLAVLIAGICWLLASADRLRLVTGLARGRSHSTARG